MELKLNRLDDMESNRELEKSSLKQSFKSAGPINDVVYCLEQVLKNKTPFALYIATLDKSDCIWIFDPSTIYEMLGGEKEYKKIKASFDSNLPSEESGCFVLFIIMKKINPHYVIKIDLDIIEEIISELYDEL